MPFSVLQTRIGRKNIGKKILREAPVSFIAYDILEHNGEDIRSKTQSARRQILEQIIAAIRSTALQLPLELSPLISFHSWEEL
ncbi:ATP-dependent DNA ligase, partial [Acinetobacter baumannii]